MSTPALIDVDPGNDDAVLLALAIASDELDVSGVTTVAGNAPLADTSRNARAVLDWLGAGEVPVSEGADRPLTRAQEGADVHGPGGLFGDIPEPERSPIETPGPVHIVEEARARRGELTLVAVGPLTNVAIALALEPDLPELLDDLVVMGGSAWAGGNTTPAAEFNFYADPEAARRVVRDAAPKIVGLDVTGRATISPGKLRELSEAEEPLHTIAGWLAYAEPDAVGDVLAVEDRPSIHDPTVGAHLVADVLEFESYPATVETCGDSRGALVADDRRWSEAEPNAEVAVDIDLDAFRSAILGTLRELA